MATADAAMYRAKQRGGAVSNLAETPPPGSPHSRTEHLEEEDVLPAPEHGLRRAVAVSEFSRRLRGR